MITALCTELRAFYPISNVIFIERSLPPILSVDGKRRKEGLKGPEAYTPTSVHHSQTLTL